MTDGRGTRWFALVALLAGAVALWGVRREPAAPARAPAPRAASAPGAALMRALATARPRERRRAGETSPDHAHERPADGLPHPVTPEHLRLYRDVDLLRAADAEIKAGRFDAARALVAQHRRELSGMSALEEEGLLLLADCAEQRSAGNVARVQRFYDEHTDSTLRRRLRRACLEQPSRAAVQ